MAINKMIEATNNIKNRYHKKYYFREDNFYFTFFGVNEVYPKEKTCNNVLEYEFIFCNNFNIFSVFIIIITFFFL